MKNLFSILFIVGVSFINTNIFAAEALIVGKSEVKAEPDQVQLVIHIASECYPSPKAATEAADKATKEIFDFVKHTIKKSAETEITSHGGYTQPFSKYINEGRGSKQVCVNTFQKRTSITILSDDIEHFQEQFNAIQVFAYKKFSKGSANKLDALTYVNMSQPQAILSFTKHMELIEQASNVALTNAKQKLIKMLMPKKAQNLRIIYISETPPQLGPVVTTQHSDYAPRAKSAMLAEAATVPIQFAKQKISQTIYVKFSFDDL